MIDNLKIILSEFDKLKGQFIITSMNNVRRLVAIGEDKYDYYYIIWNGKKFKWYSCACTIIPLKGYLKNEDYEKLINLSKLNDIDQTLESENFSLIIKEYINNFSEDEKFITDLCFELN